jgi:hypothetical protein
MIFTRQVKTPLEKELLKLDRQEQNFRSRWVGKRKPGWTRTLEHKVPEKLQSTLDKAFVKAFAVLFNKGTGVLEKTYRKDELQKTYQVNQYESDLRQDHKSLKRFSQGAVNTELANTLMSGVSGIGLGVLGIGLPDILVFTGFMLKGIYEIALKFGFDYETDKERQFILLLIQGAVSEEQDFGHIDSCLNYFIEHEEFPEHVATQNRIKMAADSLSHELLYMKFLQGIPIIGVVGGAYDVVYTKRILEYAKIKYRRRFLFGEKNKNVVTN